MERVPEVAYAELENYHERYHSTRRDNIVIGWIPFYKISFVNKRGPVEMYASSWEDAVSAYVYARSADSRAQLTAMFNLPQEFLDRNQ